MRDLFSCRMWDLVPWPGIKPRPSALGAQSLTHWTTKQGSPGLLVFYWQFLHLVVSFFLLWYQGWPHKMSLASSHILEDLGEDWCKGHHFKEYTQWRVVHLQCCASITSSSGRTFWLPTKEVLYSLSSHSSVPPSPSLWQPLAYFLSLWICLSWNSHTDVVFCVWHFSLSTIIQGSSVLWHVSALHSFVWIYHVLSIELFLPFGFCEWCCCEQVLVLAWIPVFKYLGYIPRSGIAESYGNSMFHFLRNKQIVFLCDCTFLSTSSIQGFPNLHILINMC